MLKYILAAIVIAIAWAIVVVLNLPWIIAIAATAVVLFVLLAIFLYRRYRALKAAREIEKALNAQAEEQARSVRPEQQAEVRAMQAEVNRALAALKNSRLGKGGADALYALPWYVIIGPPGAGKTTALRNSGIQFPYTSAATGGGIRGVGGTRNCEWWLTNEGVLLDTAGRYVTEDDDRDEWLSFLDLLKKNRPQKPLNGVIVAVNVAELGTAREQQIEAVARRVREKVDEVQARLQVSLPVYVLFTKCDLIQGFTEFFDDLRKSERGQIWGFTVPMARPVDATPSGLFTEQFDEMVKVVEGRMLRRISAEPSLGKREQVYQFPQQFQSLKQNLADFLDGLFASNVYQGAPMLRGVYFTSGTQEGRPIDQLAEKLRSSFGLPAAAAAPVQQPTEAKSYFLRDVFSRVVFPDQNIAVVSKEELDRRRKRKYYFAAGAFGLAMLLSVIPAWAYMKNRDLTARCNDATALIQSHVQQRAAAPLTLAELQPLRDVVSELKGYHDGHAPLDMTFGMFQGDALYPKMGDLYATAMQRHVISPLFLADVRDMQAFTARLGEQPPSSTERSQYYDVLKLHLVLSQPKATGETPLTDDRLVTFTADQIAREWSTRVAQGNALDARTQGAMRQNAQLFTELLRANPNLSFQRNVPVVTSVRTALNRTSSIDIALNRIIADVEPMGFTIDLNRAIGRSPEHVYQVGPPETHRVRGAFTRAGWEGYVRDRLKQAPELIVGEAWVLGQAPNVDQARQVAETLVQVRSQYFEQYIAEWRNFVQNLRVREPGTAEVAQQMLQWFTQGGTPAYAYLMRTVADNTRLPDPDEASARAGSNTLLQVAERELNNRLNRTRSGIAANAVGRSAIEARTGGATGPSTFLHRDDVEHDPMLHGLVTFGVPPTPPPAAAPAPGAPPAPPPTPASTDLTVYQEQLAFVRDALTTYLANPGQPSAPMLTTLSTAQTRVEALINGAEVDSRPVLRNLLPPPINFTVARAMGALGGAGSDRWCSAVVVPFERTLHDRYPFNPNGHDAAIGDIAAFYAPTRGALWAFYTEGLATDVPRVGDEYQFVTRLGQSTSAVYRPELQRFLNRSQDITTVLFPPAGAGDAAAGSGPKVEFEVRLRPSPQIAELTFSVDGDELRYSNGPEEWHRYEWPGGGRLRGAKIRARGLNGIDETIEQDGEWGIYRLFELGQVRGSADTRIFSVTWHLRDQNIDIGVDVRPARSENPFFGVPRRDASAGRYLAPFRAENVTAPHPIAQRGRPCNLSDLPNNAPPPAGPAEGGSGHHHHRHH